MITEAKRHTVHVQNASKCQNSCDRLDRYRTRSFAKKTKFYVIHSNQNYHLRENTSEDKHIMISLFNASSRKTTIV